jgi:hypothetical protein
MMIQGVLTRSGAFRLDLVDEDEACRRKIDLNFMNDFRSHTRQRTGVEWGLIRRAGYAMETLGYTGRFRSLRERMFFCPQFWSELEEILPVDKP